MPVAFATNDNHADHRTTRHVERPERLTAVFELLARAPVRRHLDRISFERPDLEVLYLAHREDHVQHVARAIRAGYDGLDADTYIAAGSLNVALDAVGALLGITRHVLDGLANSGFAAIRPPGHHATPDRSMGFCLFSNVAIATRWAQSVAGIGRVLIVDFDVHHGNGTQDIFYDDPDVMYMSIHQTPFYPGTGDADERGTGDAVDCTINIPLQAGAGDDVYLHVFREILRPRALRFDPELIFLSAGYDAHWKDPLGGMQVTTKGFSEMVRELSDWANTCCDGRLIAALEGGYHLNALAHSVIATLDVLNDGAARVEDPIGSAPGETTPLQHFLRTLDGFSSID